MRHGASRFREPLDFEYNKESHWNGYGQQLKAESFTAAIRHSASGRFLKNQNNNTVILGTGDSDDTACLWNFIKNDDGTYRIQSAKNNDVFFDDKDYGTAKNNPVQLYTDHDYSRFDKIGSSCG